MQRLRYAPASANLSVGPRRRTTSATPFKPWASGESGTERLEQAVEAYRAALEEYTRERVPLDWAMTQNNLGNALQALGKRGKRHGAPRTGRGGLSCGARRVHPRACAARLGYDAEQPRRRPSNAGRARKRHGAPRSGREGLSCGARRAHPRARTARLGHDAETTSATPFKLWASGKAARRASNRPWRPIVRRSKSTPASAYRSIGP